MQLPGPGWPIADISQPFNCPSDKNIASFCWKIEFPSVSPKKAKRYREIKTCLSKCRLTNSSIHRSPMQHGTQFLADMRLTFSSNKDFPGRACQDAISDRRIGNADTLEEYGVSPVGYAYDWRD